MPRVMLERPNYFQKLVNLGCKPDDLGTVTWNSVTRSVDVSGSVHLHNKGLTRLPFQFGKVGGNFGCSDNQLTSLIGAPKEVGGSFWCIGSHLTTLDGIPKVIHGDLLYIVTDFLRNVSALLDCSIIGFIRLYGILTEQDRIKSMLHDLAYREMSKIICRNT